MTTASALNLELVVLLCTHNGQLHLPAQLESLADQTQPLARLVVHDWGSTDHTLDIVQRFADTQSTTHAGMRVDVVSHHEAPGASSSFCRALSLLINSDVPFDYVLLCDQDDIWHNDKTAHIAMAARAGADFIWSDVRLIDATGGLLAPSFYAAHGAFARPQLTDRLLDHESLLLVNPVVGMSLAISRRLLQRAEPALHLPWLMHDWGLGILAVGNGMQTRFVDETLADYRQHGSNLLGASTGIRLRQRWNKARSHFKRLSAQMQLAALAGGPAWKALAPQLLRGEGDAGQLPPSRWAVATAARTSHLLRWHSRWLLACAVLLFWPRKRDLP